MYGWEGRYGLLSDVVKIIEFFVIYLLECLFFVVYGYLLKYWFSVEELNVLRNFVVKIRKFIFVFVMRFFDVFSFFILSWYFDGCLWVIRSECFSKYVVGDFVVFIVLFSGLYFFFWLCNILWIWNI